MEELEHLDLRRIVAFLRRLEDLVGLPLAHATFAAGSATARAASFRASRRFMRYSDPIEFAVTQHAGRRSRPLHSNRYSQGLRLTKRRNRPHATRREHVGFMSSRVSSTADARAVHHPAIGQLRALRAGLDARQRKPARRVVDLAPGSSNRPAVVALQRTWQYGGLLHLACSAGLGRCANGCWNWVGPRPAAPARSAARPATARCRPGAGSCRLEVLLHHRTVAGLAGQRRRPGRPAPARAAPPARAGKDWRG